MENDEHHGKPWKTTSRKAKVTLKQKLINIDLRNGTGRGARKNDN